MHGVNWSLRLRNADNDDEVLYNNLTMPRGHRGDDNGTRVEVSHPSCRREITACCCSVSSVSLRGVVPPYIFDR